MLDCSSILCLMFPTLIPDCEAFVNTVNKSLERCYYTLTPVSNRLKQGPHQSIGTGLPLRGAPRE